MDECKGGGSRYCTYNPSPIFRICRFSPSLRYRPPPPFPRSPPPFHSNSKHVRDRGIILSRRAYDWEVYLRGDSVSFWIIGARIIGSLIVWRSHRWRKICSSIKYEWTKLILLSNGIIINISILISWNIDLHFLFYNNCKHKNFGIFH